MKLGEIIRFEAGYQGRRAPVWLFFAGGLGLTFWLATEAYVAKARSGGFFFNAPFNVAELTLVGSVMGLLVATALAGDAAARDVRTRMHPLVYTSPAGKAAYLGGRFLAAFALTALILSAVPLALLLAALRPGIEAGLVGPFRASTYLGPYLSIALPNAFVATALLFSLAALTRRATASYLGAVLLLTASILAWTFVAGKLGRWELAKVIDPLGMTVLAEMARAWTAAEKNTRVIGLQGPLVINRLVWIGVALGVLALTHLRFRFAHHAAGGRRRPGARRDARAAGGDAAAAAPPVRVARTPARRTFGAATHARQTGSVAAESFRAIVTSWGGGALALLTVLIVLSGPVWFEHMGVPMVPTTGRMIGFLGGTGELVWMVIPLLTAFYAGELVWRERDAGLGEIAAAAPAPDWVPLAGKLLGLGMVLATLQALVMAAAMLVQARLGYHRFEVGVYARVLLGIRLADYLLFAVLAVVVHAVVNQKHVAHAVVVIAYATMAFGPALGIGDGLLVYGSDPGWGYSDLSGFGAYAGPWLWFKLYWAAWALLLAIAARLLWVRGTENGPAARLRLARGRLTRRTAAGAAAAAGLVLCLGGFVFYNTHVLNPDRAAPASPERRAEYERRYGRYRGVPQPRVTAARLRVEIHPARGSAEIRGTYQMVNDGAVPIDSIHVLPNGEVEVGAIGFDRPARRVLDDRALGYRIYALERPLRPGDTLRLGFTVRHAPRGFPERGIDASVVANGTHFGSEWLPAVGYQAERELSGAGDRRAHRLPPRPALPAPDDAAARWNGTGAERIALDAVVGTDAGQTAVAPGRLLRAWTEHGRRYFHYATDAPIRNEYAFFSAAYAVREGVWIDPTQAPGRTVAIQVFHHPGHAWNVEGMVRSARASLASYSRRFGPYPQGQIRLVEYPSPGISLHGAPIDISYQEGFSLLDPRADPREIDFPFAVVAHEAAHQWWGNQLTPARAEGGAVLSETLAWYSALGVVEETYGPEHLARLLAMMREAYLQPHARGAVPLLRGNDWLLAYRKGPFVMYALREYAGDARVNAALRRLFQRHAAGRPPLPTSLDLYRELRAATPDSLHPLLHDLFEANTYWELETRTVRAQPAAGGAWRVTLDVHARKIVVDTAGVETEIPMDDAVEIGVFGDAVRGAPGPPLYRRMHRVRSGGQRITVTVRGKPARAGIDPRTLLIDDVPGDNVAEVTPGEAAPGARPGPRH